MVGSRAMPVGAVAERAAARRHHLQPRRPPELTGRSGPLTWLLVPVGALLVVMAYRLPRHLIAGQARLAGWLLALTAAARLSVRVDELTTTRAAAVGASAVELRRLERDLHDGAQARLVALTMNLGMAEDAIEADPTGAKALLAGHGPAPAPLSELRDLVRGIHPPSWPIVAWGVRCKHWP